mmetsp:Transcript_19715/g.47610  ORF Transcript_19715/g.47610 Transcript_19715/m.47610 type:complete len:200 (-) Transcript_19715:1772-2371(-)
MISFISIFYHIGDRGIGILHHFLPDEKSSGRDRHRQISYVLVPSNDCVCVCFVVTNLFDKNSRSEERCLTNPSDNYRGSLSDEHRVMNSFEDYCPQGVHRVMNSFDDYRSLGVHHVRNSFDDYSPLGVHRGRNSFGDCSPLDVVHRVTNSFDNLSAHLGGGVHLVTSLYGNYPHLSVHHVTMIPCDNDCRADGDRILWG